MFFKYFNQFIQELKLSHKKVVVGVSGGVDSMLLLFALKSLNFDIQAVHINHGTRDENELEEDMVRKYCAKLRVPLSVHYYKHKEGNFEMMAREFRYSIFKSFNNHYIATAHHIDDSFEWHLMQKFKSGSKNNLGIPARNGKIIRPFMCLTKAQIYSLAKENNIPFMEDSSNNNNDYERNFVRNEIIPLIKKKYPKYLKHYVNQMNNRAKELNIHISQERKKENGTPTEIVLPITATYYQIEDAIKKLSSKKRGKISNNLNSMLKCINSGKRNFYMLFSGKVTVQIYKDKLKIYNSSKN